MREMDRYMSLVFTIILGGQIRMYVARREAFLQSMYGIESDPWFSIFFLLMNIAIDITNCDCGRIGTGLDW